MPAFIEAAMPFARRDVLVARGRRVSVIDHDLSAEDEVRTVVLFHGNPTWSYLWRKVIARLGGQSRGLRIVAPDLLGFGASDKPRRPGDHRLEMHLDAMVEVLEQLGVERPVLVGQDWGGPIAAGVGMLLTERGNPPSGFVFGNTAVIEPVRPFRPKAFHRFSHLPIVSEIAFYGALFPVPVLRTTQGDRSSIGLTETGAYAWPFLHLLDRAGPLGLARMVPNSEDHPSTPVLDSIGRYMRTTTQPMALVWGTRDPILGRALDRHRKAFPHASLRVTEAGHFLQEEVPGELADAILEVISKSDAAQR